MPCLHSVSTSTMLATSTPSTDKGMYNHIIIITHPRGLYLICKHDAQESATLGWSVCIADTLSVLQLVCSNST